MRILALLMILSPAAVAAGAAEEAGAGMALRYTKGSWPMSIVDRPLVVAPGMTEVTLGFNKDISADNGFFTQPRPLTLGLTARYGIGDRLQAGLDLGGLAGTSPGVPQPLSVCLTYCEPTGFFNALSIGAGYALVASRELNFVPALSLLVNNVPAFSTTDGLGSTIAVGVSPGFLFGWRVNEAFQLFANGGFYFPFVARDDTQDRFSLHVEPRFALAPRFSVAPYAGWNLSLKDTSAYAVPVGVNFLYIVQRTFDVGAGFELNDVAAKSAESWSDRRSFNVFGTLRL